MGGCNDMACPKAGALSTRCPNFPTVERKVSSLGKLLFLPWKFHFPRLESFWKHVKKIRFITFFIVLFLKKVHSWEGVTEMVLGLFLLVL